MSEKCNRGLGDFYFSVLLKWQTWEQVLRDPLVGGLFENLVVPEAV